MCLTTSLFWQKYREFVTSAKFPFALFYNQSQSLFGACESVAPFQSVSSRFSR